MIRSYALRVVVPAPRTAEARLIDRIKQAVEKHLHGIAHYLYPLCVRDSGESNLRQGHIHVFRIIYPDKHGTVYAWVETPDDGRRSELRLVGNADSDVRTGQLILLALSS